MFLWLTLNMQSAGPDVSYILYWKTGGPVLAVFQWVFRLRSRASWMQRGGRGSACSLWFTVPVSRQARSSGSCTPAPPPPLPLTPPYISLTSQPSCWKAGRGARRPRLARLTRETKTQCYQSASASVWCQGVLLIRESREGYLLCLYHLSRLPPRVLYGWRLVQTRQCW